MERDRTAVAAGAAQTQGRTSARFQPRLFDRHCVRAANRHAVALRSPGVGLRQWRILLPSPAELAKSKKVKWKKVRVSIYGKRVRVWFKTCDALWYNSAGTRMLRIVVVRDPSGRRKDDCFFSTDRTLSATAIIEQFARRWPLEVAFYNAKQHLGMEDPQNRKPLAVERTAPMALYLHTLVIIWFARHGRFNLDAYRKARPWYPQKRTPSFVDMLNCLQAATIKETINHDPAQKLPVKKILKRLAGALTPAA